MRYRVACVHTSAICDIPALQIVDCSITNTRDNHPEFCQWKISINLSPFIRILNVNVEINNTASRDNLIRILLALRRCKRLPTLLHTINPNIQMASQYTSELQLLSLMVTEVVALTIGMFWEMLSNNNPMSCVKVSTPGFSVGKKLKLFTFLCIYLYMRFLAHSKYA